MGKSKDNLILQHSHLKYTINLPKSIQKRKQLLWFKNGTSQSLSAVQNKRQRDSAKEHMIQKCQKQAHEIMTEAEGFLPLSPIQK